MLTLENSFLNLAQHRFASHCCEMLFQRSAWIASKEMEDDYTDDTATNELFATMESLFLYMLNVRLHHNQVFVRVLIGVGARTTAQTPMH